MKLSHALILLSVALVILKLAGAVHIGWLLTLLPLALALLPAITVVAILLFTAVATVLLLGVAAIAALFE